MSKKARLALVAGFAVALSVGGSVQAQTSSDESAAILVWPRIVFDSTGSLFGSPTDTLLSISSNATSSLKQAHCFLVNATSHCSNSGNACLTSASCGGGICVPGWNETDFNIFLTQDQPLAWLASSGMSASGVPIGQSYGGRCSHNNAIQCFSNANCAPAGVCQFGPHGGQNNIGTGIPPVPNDPFIGSLTCIQYDPSLNPPRPDQSPTANSLIGEATIFTNNDAIMDGSKYNAVGFKAVAGAGADTDNVLELGTPMQNGQPTADYDGCAGSLIFNHYFDGATDPMSVGNGTNSSNGETSTNLTLVPCGNNILARQPGNVVAQFLVFNEFEQRLSASTTVDCVYDKQISNIDTPNNSRSIWSAGVSGTLTGQTRIQGVGNASTGNGLTGIAILGTESSAGLARAAYSLDQQGSKANGDLLIIP